MNLIDIYIKRRTIGMQRWLSMMFHITMNKNNYTFDGTCMRIGITPGTMRDINLRVFNDYQELCRLCKIVDEKLQR